jgi:glycine cleavage system H protein
MHLPEALLYTPTHEWVRLEPDGTFSVGLTDFAQESLGEVVFLELPEPGRQLKAGEESAVVESVKAASDVYAPVAGVIVEANKALIDEPAQVNKEPYAAWLYRIRPAGTPDLSKLLKAETYRKGLA